MEYRRFEIDLPLLLRNTVKDKFNIDLVESLQSVVRVPNTYNTTGGYRRFYVAATYDLNGFHDGRPYFIRVYATIGDNYDISEHTLDHQPEGDALSIGYNLQLDKSRMYEYKLEKRFPVIGDTVVNTNLFCLHADGARLLVNGNPICLGEDTPPVITLLPDPDTGALNPLIVTQGETFEDPFATASDLIDGDITDNIVVTGSVNMDIPGTYTLTYTATNMRSQSASVIRQVVVAGVNQPPEIEQIMPHCQYDCELGPNLIPQGAVWIDPGATAEDPEEGDLTASVVADKVIDTSIIGPVDVTYTVTDIGGLTATDVRHCLVFPAPTIELASRNGVVTPLEVNQGEEWVDPGFTATRPGWIFQGEGWTGPITTEDVTHSVGVTGTVDTTTPGSYTLTYSSFYDYPQHNPKSTVTRTVVVVPSNPPTITLLGDNPMSIIRGDAWNDPGATAVDNEDGDITDDIIVTGDTVDTSSAGTYNVTYTVTDSSGKSASVTRVVNVLAPNTPPTLILFESEQSGEVSYRIPKLVRVWTFRTNNYDYNNIKPTELANIELLDADGNNILQPPYDSYIHQDGYHPEYAFDGDPNTVGTAGTWATLSQVGFYAFSDPNKRAKKLRVQAGPDISYNHAPGGSVTLRHYDIQYGKYENHWPNNILAIQQLGYHTDGTLVSTVEDWSNGEIKELDVDVDPYEWPDPGWYANDAEDGNLTDQVVLSGDTVNVYQPGEYNLTYTVTDSQGLSTTKERKITVYEPYPTLDIDDDPSIFYDDAYHWNSASGQFTAPAATATDDTDGDITDQINIIGLDQFDDQIAEDVTLYLRYEVTNSIQRKAIKVVPVKVTVANSYPVLVVEHDPFMYYNDAYHWVPGYGPFNPPPAIATDDIDGDISDQIVINGLEQFNGVSPTSEFVVHITYEVTNSLGNTTTEDLAVSIDGQH